MPAHPLETELPALTSQRTLGGRPYHGVVAVAGQDDDVNGRRVVSHADAAVSRPVLPVHKVRGAMGICVR